jgi:hypothetical protein
VTDQMKLKVVAVTSDARAAGQLKNAAGLIKGLAEVMFEGDEGYGEQVKTVLNEVRIGTRGNNVTLDLTVDKAVVDKLTGKKVSNQK